METKKRKTKKPKKPFRKQPIKGERSTLAGTYSRVRDTFNSTIFGFFQNDSTAAKTFKSKNKSLTFINKVITDKS